MHVKTFAVSKQKDTFKTLTQVTSDINIFHSIQLNNNWPSKPINYEYILI